MPRRVVYLILAGITVLAGYLRWSELGVPALWLDEILHLQVTRDLDWSNPWGLIVGLREARGYSENGALYYALQTLGQLLAPGDLGVRVLPALLGTLSVPLFALVAGLFAKQQERHLVELTAGLCLAVAPMHVYYSREGRPYYLLMALAVLLLGVLARAARAKPLSLRTLCWFGGLSVLSAYVGLHTLPILASAAAVVVLMTLATLPPLAPKGPPDGSRGARRRGLLGLLAGLAAAIAMCAVLYLSQTQHNVPTLNLSEQQQALVEAPVFEALFSDLTVRRFLASMTTAGQTSPHVGERAWLIVVLAACGLISLLVAKSPTGARDKPRDFAPRMPAGIVSGMFLLPALTSVLALWTTGRWFHVRYTAVALPAFLLLVTFGAVAIGNVASRWVRRWLPGLPEWLVRASSIGVTLAVAVAPNVGPALADPHRKLDWRQMAEWIDQLVLPDEPVIVATEWPRVCLGHYLEQRDREVEFIKIWDNPDLGQEAIAEHPRGWMVSAGVRKTDAARDWMRDFPTVLQRTREEFQLFYFPDLSNLVDSLGARQAAGRTQFFEDFFSARGRAFDFDDGNRLLQGSGWSWFSEKNSEATYQWAVGREARLGLPIGPPTDLEVEFLARPFEYAGAEQQVIGLWLGDQFLEEFILEPGWNRLRVPVGREVWASQAPVLRLLFRTSARPSDVLENSTDERDLAAAFDWLRVVEPTAR